MNETKNFHCTIEASMSLIGGKYKPIILWHIIKQARPLRFTELRRYIPNTTPKMLTQHLRELEEDGLIRRKVFPVVPPHTEYSLTELGQTIVPLIYSLRNWGVFYFDYKGLENPCPDN